MRRRRTNPIIAAIRSLLLPAAAVCVLLFFVYAVSNLQNGTTEEDLRQLEQALRRACVACYAAEGVYPPNVEYLEEHYGIQIDGERYVVHYDVFAENLMPDITVLEQES